MKAVWITEAIYKDSFTIFLKFNDGVSGIVDLKGKLNGRIFEPLKDESFFESYKRVVSKEFMSNFNFNQSIWSSL